MKRKRCGCLWGWLYAGLSLFSGFLIPQTDNAAHLGGLLTGILIGLMFYFFDLLPQSDVTNDQENVIEEQSF